MLDARCDFCSQPFRAFAWNQRTCLRCASDGRPDQSNLPWLKYSKILLAYLRDTGRRSPLAGAALQMQRRAGLRDFQRS